MPIDRYEGRPEARYLPWLAAAPISLVTVFVLGAMCVRGLPQDQTAEVSTLTPVERSSFAALPHLQFTYPDVACAFGYTRLDLLRLECRVPADTQTQIFYVYSEETFASCEL